MSNVKTNIQIKKVEKFTPIENKYSKYYTVLLGGTVSLLQGPVLSTDLCFPW